ncbi:MAG: aromatic amino acid transport family protein [bacterium]|nr:aromatic amino acid transport family protein [bacterium]
MDRRFISAVAVLMGSIIGVGIFGIPFAFAKAGFLTGFLFLIGLGTITLLLNLAYGEIILRTDRSHGIVGYAGIYLGEFWKKVAFFTFVLSSYSALLAYIIVGGEFLSNIFSFQFYFSSGSLSFVFFLAGALAVAGGLKMISMIDMGMFFLYIAGAFLVLIWGLPQIQFGNLTTFHKEFWFLPYGVLLFALSGSSIVLQREVLDGQEFRLKKAIAWGTIIPAIIYAVFAFAVVGISGDATSPESFSGLLPFLGPQVIWFGSIFGLLAIFTSFLTLGDVLLESFRYDFKLKKIRAWLLVVMPPWLMFMLGANNFINVINLAGAVAIGLQLIVFIFIYGKVKRMGHRIPEYSLDLPKYFWYGLIALSVFGIVYTLGR